MLPFMRVNILVYRLRTPVSHTELECPRTIITDDEHHFRSHVVGALHAKHPWENIPRIMGWYHRTMAAMLPNE